MHSFIGYGGLVKAGMAIQVFLGALQSRRGSLPAKGLGRVRDSIRRRMDQTRILSGHTLYARPLPGPMIWIVTLHSLLRTRRTGALFNKSVSEWQPLRGPPL